MEHFVLFLHVEMEKTFATKDSSLSLIDVVLLIRSR